MSIMGFQKKIWTVGGWGEPYPSFFLDFWNFFNFAKPLTSVNHCLSNLYHVLPGRGGLELRSLNREVLGSNPIDAVSNLEQVGLPHVS